MTVRRVILWVAGVALVAVSGFLAATWASDRSVEQLAPRRAAALRPTRRVIRMDLPGFGLTGPDPRDNYSITNYVRFMRAVLDSLRVTHAVFVGNSLGGAIAWAVALDRPARVAQLVLVDAAGYPNHTTAVPIGFRIARMPLLKRLVWYSLPRRVEEASVRSMFGDPSRVTPELVDRYYDLTLRTGNRGAVVARFRQPSANSLVLRRHGLRVPTLIIWGGRDGLISPGNAVRFHRDIAGSQLVVFPKLGHIPQEEDPAVTVRALQGFLARFKLKGRLRGERALPRTGLCDTIVARARHGRA